MTIIKVTLSCKIRLEHKHSNSAIDWDTIEINKEDCEYHCKCRHVNKLETKSLNRGSLKSIEKLVEPHYLYDYCYFNYNNDEDNKQKEFTEIIQKIDQIIENNKYARIQKVLSDTRKYDSQKYYDIRCIINDDREYQDSDISFDENDITEYPHTTEFKLLNDNKYVAEIHIDPSIYNNNIYITSRIDTDGFCCRVGSYENIVPVQLSVIPPIKKSDIFLNYDYSNNYRERYGVFEYDYFQSN